VLSDLPVADDDRVLVDYRTADDAGVYRLGDQAIVQTVDFFTPIVDDPEHYGRIAAANALSDVYAMGGTPITALAIAAFPPKTLDAETIRAIFHGGWRTLTDAGVALLGGHTVRDQEVKFGYAVTGVIDPARIWSNACARPGDALLLTKALGTGIVSTAIKYQRAPADVVAAAVRSMLQLNRAAARVLSASGDVVHACTDVTGFGLLGHACEMSAASRVTLAIEASRVPLLPGVLPLVAENRTGGGASNEEHFGPRVVDHAALDEDPRALFYDPQTSGGLLVAVPASDADTLCDRLVAEGVPAVRIGAVEAAVEALVRVI
jgi:selenide, water dikinase